MIIMNKSKIVLSIGIWTALLPYLGFPLFIKNILFSLTGLLLMYFAYILYKESKSSRKEEKSDVFSENGNSFSENKKEEDFLNE
jgi:hypothetical protein